MDLSTATVIEGPEESERMYCELWEEIGLSALDGCGR